MKMIILKRYVFAVVFFVAAASSVTAQQFEPGKVTKAELLQEKHAIEPSAEAAVLYRKGLTYLDFDNNGQWVIVTEVTSKIKIYTKEGYRYATVEVPYYTGVKGEEKVEFSNVITYNLANDKVEKTRLTDEGKFTEGAEKKWKIKKITLPAVKEGSVIEYKYTITSPYLTTLPVCYFQQAIPVDNVEHGINIPQYFAYNRILSPYFPIKEKQERVEMTRHFSNSNPKGAYGKSNSVLQTQTGEISFYETRKMYTAQNIPSLSDELYVDNIKNYTAYVKHELASTQFPNAPKKEYASDWLSVTKSIYNQEDFGKEMSYTSYFEKDLEAALNGVVKRDEVIKTIFSFVQNRMAWNGNYGYACKDGVKNAYAGKSGNVAEINLMLIAMLRYAGLNANPIVLSTRENGHVGFINRDGFNYVIAGVEAQKGIIYLDATSKNSQPDILPLRDLNGTGRIIRENQTSAEVDLTPILKSKENTIVVATVKPDGTITGQAKTQYSDYNAYIYREQNGAANKDLYIEKLEKKLGGIAIERYNVNNDKDTAKPVAEDFTFSGSNSVEAIDGKLYISPLLFYTMQQNPFTAEKRTYPIDFLYPQQERYTISFTLPDGYTIESLPAPFTTEAKDGIGSFKYNIAASGKNQVQIVVVTDINYAMVTPGYYEAVKTFYTDMVKKQSEKIVLKKV